MLTTRAARPLQCNRDLSTCAQQRQSWPGPHRGTWLTWIAMETFGATDVRNRHDYLPRMALRGAERRGNLPGHLRYVRREAGGLTRTHHALTACSLTQCCSSRPSWYGDKSFSRSPVRPVHWEISLRWQSSSKASGVAHPPLQG